MKHVPRRIISERSALFGRCVSSLVTNVVLVSMNYNMNIPFGMIDYRNMSMDIRMYIEIEQDSFERSK